MYKGKIGRAIRKGALFSVLLLVLIPASASAVSPQVIGTQSVTIGENRYWQYNVYSRYTDWSYIRIVYPYYGEWRQMNGPYWNSAASGAEQYFAYGSFYPNCGPIAVQVILRNYSAETVWDSNFIYPCQKRYGT
jgi:hypothetical protein